MKESSIVELTSSKKEIEEKSSIEELGSKILAPVEPMMTIRRIKVQSKIKNIYIPGNEDMVGEIAVVLKNSKVGKNRGIKEGDYVLLRPAKTTQAFIYPKRLTKDNTIPAYPGEENQIELIDPLQVLAVYREEKDEENTTD